VHIQISYNESESVWDVKDKGKKIGEALTFADAQNILRKYVKERQK